MAAPSFPNVQPDQTLRGEPQGGAGPIPRAGPSRPAAGGGASFTASGMVLPLCATRRLPISAVNVDGSISTSSGSMRSISPFPGRVSPAVPAWATGSKEQITAGQAGVPAAVYALELDANRRETRLINVKGRSWRRLASTAVMSPWQLRLAQGDHLLCGERHGAQCPPLPR